MSAQHEAAIVILRKRIEVMRDICRVQENALKFHKGRCSIVDQALRRVDEIRLEWPGVEPGVVALLVNGEVVVKGAI